MNILAPAVAIQQQKLKAQLKAKRAGIRAIDKGTLYDVPGKLRNLARGIENGEFGSVRNAVLVVSSFPEGEHAKEIRVFALGGGGQEEAHWMLSTATTRVEPA